MVMEDHIIYLLKQTTETKMTILGIGPLAMFFILFFGCIAANVAKGAGVIFSTIYVTVIWVAVIVAFYWVFIADWRWAKMLMWGVETLLWMANALITLMGG